MATTYLKNTNSHGVSLDDGPRQRAGSVFAVEDAAQAKKYEALAGVEKVSQEDFDDYRAASGPTSEKSGTMLLSEEYAEQRVEARLAVTAAPLQRVVGDDLAPLGPPAGVLSTKLEEAEKDLAHRLAFADHEAVDTVPEPEEKLTFSSREKAPVVHNEQARATEAANEVASEINKVVEDAQPDAPAEPEPEPEPSDQDGS